MPELPDLLYISRYLQRQILNRRIVSASVHQPVVIRNIIGEPVEGILRDLFFTRIDYHGPFLRFTLSSMVEIVTNLMLAGRVQHQKKGDHPLGFKLLALKLDDGTWLNICDEQKMAKLYIVHPGDYAAIPGFVDQGVDIRSKEFSEDCFTQLAAKHSRKQVRVFINDHSVLSSIGNAYADEILFAAKIHPKTIVGSLGPDDRAALYRAIATVMQHGIDHVAEAAQPIHKKVRDHMKVRNRQGEPCLICGTKLRREGVHGYDVFFCPTCQPVTRKVFIDWGKRPGGQAPEGQTSVDTQS
jgi:formamidopyrimidine-DNA glycosylase